MESTSNQEENTKETKIYHFDSSESTSGVIESHEINDDEHDIIKGDTIGETVYSAKWVLDTLVSLTKVCEDEWTETIEHDLCTLWDMTAEKDIVKFLIENDFYNIALLTLKVSEEPRLTEIIVGIIGNMCCETEALDELAKLDELVAVTLELISSDDKETLIQVLRILQAAFWDIKKNPDSLWVKKIQDFDILGEAIIFILKSSTCEELLAPAIDLIYSISDIELPDKSNNFIECVFDVDQLIFAVCEAMIELTNEKDDPHVESQLKNIENWLNIIMNISEKDLLKFSDSNNDENYKKINIVLLKILKSYENLGNLIFLEEKCLPCIQQCIKIVLSFQKNEMPLCLELIQIILKVVMNLKAAKSESEFENSEDLKQLYHYTTNYWIETLKTINNEQMLGLLRLCDCEIVNGIIEFTNTLSGIPENTKTELLQVRSKLFDTNN